ncbi:MAG: hypothetical protein CBE34_01380 [bacterium TMED274]|nr:MAG: hypothetical protein CBE34_01380 [bacterium TMED274]|tara:strand:- start:30352 stop:31584 length:1233 start_codon:yes stop_codon:yes gene_type:complete
MQNKYTLFFLITIAIGIVIVFKNLFTSSINIQTNVKDIVSSEITELDNPKDYVDVAIKNVIVYPNRFDKKSFYIDIEINNKNGDELTQITLSNGGKLIASDKMKLSSNKNIYFQSFLIKDNINFDNLFDVKLSSLKLEKNISNNRYSFSTKLKNEQLDIALISGSLNYNSRAIISKINNNFDHFFPTIDSHVHNFEDFWFKKYDIVIFDNFPKMPISDRWFNLFIKKIYSENTSLIMFKAGGEELNSFQKIGPLFGISSVNENDLKNIPKKTFYSKNHFKSVLINDKFLYKYLLKGDDSYVEEAIDWVSKKKDLSYTFFVGNENYYINEPVFVYGFADGIDMDKKDFKVDIYKDGIHLQQENLYFNPMSDYYFNKLKISNTGKYEIKILDEENLMIQMINVNILEELIKL